MLRKTIYLTMLVFCFGVSVNAIADKLIPFHNFNEGLRYWGHNSACNRVLKGAVFFEHFGSSFVPGHDGMVMVSVQNPASNRPPLTTYLFKQGDDDLYAFSVYYGPSSFPFRVNHQTLALRGVILNICMDGQKQSALMLDVPGGNDCVVSTHAWDYCR